MSKFTERRRASVQGMRDLMAQQGMSALEMIDHLTTNTFSVGKTIREDDTIRMLSDLRLIAVHDGEFCQYENRAKAITYAAGVYDAAYPLLVEFFTSGVKIKDDGRLYKRDQLKLNDIIDKLRRLWGRSAVSCYYNERNYYVLKISKSYERGIVDNAGDIPHAAWRTECYVYNVGDDVIVPENNQPPRVTGAEIKQAAKDIIRIEREIVDMNRELSTAKTLVEG